jgi:Zn-dependent alcohol dehydrogenase
MRAAVCVEFGAPLRIEELRLRRANEGEVSVRLAACGICHSDIAYMEGAWGGALPAVYGHEVAGVVEEVGPGINTVSPGDHVVVTLVRSCGRCALCVRGEPALCEDWPSLPVSRESPLRAPDGASIEQGLRTGGFAEQVLVDVSQVVRVPADINPECACLLACAVTTGVGAVLNTARVRAGSSVAVIGTGGVGLNVLQGAVLAGAELICAIDLVESKLAAARSFGATNVQNAGGEGLTAEIAQLTGNKGVDYVFVTAGSVAAIEQGMGLLRRGGTLVLIGFPPSGSVVGLDAERVADQGLRILGSKVGSVRPHLDIPKLVDAYEHGRLKLDELISGRYPLDSINDAVESAARGEALRPVVVF